MLCSVVKHAGSGRARKKCRGKRETKSSVLRQVKVYSPEESGRIVDHETCPVEIMKRGAQSLRLK